MRLLTALVLVGIALNTASCASRDPVSPSFNMETVDGGEATRVKPKCPKGMELRTDQDDGEFTFTCVDD